MRRSRLVVLAALGVCGLAAAQTVPDDSGFLYGRVVTEDGAVHEGRIRWGDDELSWGEFLDGTRGERPILARIPEAERRKAGTPIKILGLTVGTHHDDSGHRMLVVRFGDLAAVHPTRFDSARLVLKGGAEVEVDGGSEDLGADIHVWDAAGKETEVDWSDVERVEFAATPKSLRAGVRRLYGTVTCAGGPFTGFIQWDRDERLAGDLLDGEADGEDVKLEMGRIRSIERDGNRGSRVVTTDGETLEMTGTNDVDSDNRGIYVHDERFGRVLVSWDVFERLDLAEPPDSGPAYDDFAPGVPLQGSVTDESGAVWRGHIVLDLDESQTWDSFDADARGLSYAIPLGRIASIVPQGQGTSLVRLESGAELHLSATADAGEGNDGVAVVDPTDKLTYLPWERVRRIDLD